MTLERISAFITYCIAVVLAWLGDLSIKDASTLGGLMIGVLMLAINWYYKQRHADAFRCSYAGDNRWQAVVAGTGADGRTGESMAPD